MVCLGHRLLFEVKDPDCLKFYFKLRLLLFHSGKITFFSKFCQLSRIQELEQCLASQAFQVDN